MQLRIDHQNKIPLHLQVEELMRKLIASPEFRDGSFLPKEVELANRLGYPAIQSARLRTSWNMKAC